MQLRQRGRRDLEWRGCGLGELKPGQVGDRDGRAGVRVRDDHEAEAGRRDGDAEAEARIGRYADVHHRLQTGAETMQVCEISLTHAIVRRTGRLRRRQARDLEPRMKRGRLDLSSDDLRISPDRRQRQRTSVLSCVSTRTSDPRPSLSGPLAARSRPSNAADASSPVTANSVRPLSSLITIETEQVPWSFTRSEASRPSTNCGSPTNDEALVARAASRSACSFRSRASAC